MHILFLGFSNCFKIYLFKIGVGRGLWMWWYYPTFFVLNSDLATSIPVLMTCLQVGIINWSDVVCSSGIFCVCVYVCVLFCFLLGIFTICYIFLPFFFTLHSNLNTIAFSVINCKWLVHSIHVHHIYIWISSVTATVVTVVIMAWPQFIVYSGREYRHCMCKQLKDNPEWCQTQAACAKIIHSGTKKSRRQRPQRRWQEPEKEEAAVRCSDTGNILCAYGQGEVDGCWPRLGQE